MTMHGFTDRGPGYYRYHAFDIETEGTRATNKMTTLTLEDDGEFVVFARAPDGEPANPPSLEDRVEMKTGESIALVPCESQAEILTECRTYIEDNFSLERDILTAYNGETYRGGFDLKFLRTVAIREGIPEQFPFTNYPFTDVYDVIVGRDRINTDMPNVPSKRGTKKEDGVALAEMVGVSTEGTKDDVWQRLNEADIDEQTLVEWAAEYNDGNVPETSVNGLGEVYELLTGESVEYDEYEDSVEAVDDFKSGNLASVITHNVADVYQTGVLMEYVSKTVAQSEFKPKYL